MVETGCCVCDFALNMFLIVGAWKLLVLAYSVIKMILFYATRSENDLYERYGSKLNKKNTPEASWAVVTGASDGIGLGYCKVLAKMGFNILLVSRSESKLKEAQKEVQQFAKDV